MARKIRLFLLVAFLLVGTTSMLSGPRYETEFEYYTDATYTEVCGWKYVMCDGIYREGCQTEWYVTYPLGECPDYDWPW
jgi:hypothetical protein